MTDSLDKTIFANHPVMDHNGQKLIVSGNGNLQALSPQDRETIAFAIIDAILANAYLSSRAEATEGGFAKTLLRLDKCKETERFGAAALDFVLRHDIDYRLLEGILDRPVLRSERDVATVIL